MEKKWNTRLQLAAKSKKQRRWIEPLAYLMILSIGLTAFLWQLIAWLIPLLNVYQTLPAGQTRVFWQESFWGWLFLLFWLALIILGITGLLFSLRMKELSPERKAAQTKTFSERSHSENKYYPAIPDILLINESPGTTLTFRLPLGLLPLFPVAGLTSFALFWNITVGSVMYYLLCNTPENWQDQMFGMIIGGVFACFGIIMLADVFRRLLLLFGLGPMILEISDHPIYPGRKYRVLFRQIGNLRFRSLSVNLVCDEIARFRQGTDTMTSRKTVFEKGLFAKNDFETTPESPLHEEFFLQLPIEAMHSFRQENNEIVWRLEIRNKIAAWGELRRDCPIIVRPVMMSGPMMEGNEL